MRQLIKLFLLFTVAYLSYGCNVVKVQYGKDPLWQDEFNTERAPNKEIWTRSSVKGDTQLSTYCPSDSNAYVKDGYLHLVVNKTNNTQPQYTAGRVIANKDYHFKLGKLVVRAKAPLSAGTWPAIWLRGPRNEKGYFAEIDLLEHVKAMGDSSYEVTYHLWGNFDGKEDNHKTFWDNVPINVGEWHVYSLEILTNQIIISVDDNTVFKLKKGHYGNIWPDDQEYSLRLALAYGGFGAKKYGVDDSALPAEFLIDYVRFYNIKDE